MNKLLFLLAFTAIIGCSGIKEAPHFHRMDHVKVTKVKGKKAYLNADAYFFNPNDVNLKLKKVAISIELEGKQIGTIDQKMKVRIPANAEFKVPLDATFDIREVGLLNGLISFLGGKDLNVQYKGYIKVSMYGFSRKVPIDHMDELRF